MKTRVIAGVVGILLLAVALLAPPLAIVLVVLAASLIAIMEFRQAVQSINRTVDPLTAIFMTVMLIGNSWIGNPNVLSSIREQMISFPEGITVQLFPLLHLVEFMFSTRSVQAMAFASIVWLFSRLVFDGDRFHLDDLAMTFTSILYIPFLMSFIPYIRSMEHGEFLIWTVIIGAIFTDTAAYFVGVTLGKHKLLPKISPKKTIEGAIGGVLGSTLVMTVFGLIVPAIVKQDIPLVHFVALGFLCGFVSQLGDWSASAIKRSSGIKDFGKLIPGHGGMLDRIDSIVFVGPVIYLYLHVVVGL